MSAPSLDLKTLLVNSGVGTFGTDIFVGREPHKPDNCITLKDTGGFSPDRHDIYRPTVQVLIRNSDYATAYAKALTVRAALHEVTGSTVSGTTYIQILMMGDIIYIGHDEQNRALFSLNFEIIRT